MKRYDSSCQHWKTILGKEGEAFLLKVIGGHMRTKGYPDNWNNYYAKQDEKTKNLWKLLTDKCLENGWLNPRIKDGKLVFGSKYQAHERPPEPSSWDRAAAAAGFDPDFEKEE